MCHIITLILPSEIRMNEVEAIGKKHRGHKFKLTPWQDNSVQPWLKPGETRFLTRNKGCDCGTSLGITSGMADVESEHTDWTAEVRKKLQIKGWSAHKVERWLAEKQREQEHQMKEYADRKARLDQQAHENDDWFNLLSELLNAKQVKYVAILKRWANDKIKDRTRVNLRERGLAFLLEIEDNVIYEFY